MQSSDVMVEVVLPFGVVDGRGRRSRRAVLRPINGHGELLGAEDVNPFRAALALLHACTKQLGPFHEQDLDLSVLSSLHPIDRDFLLLQVNRLSFGDVRFHTVQCPERQCSKRVDVRFDLATVVPPADSLAASGCMTLPDGRAVHYRLPTAGDQVDMFGLPSSEWGNELLGRCVYQNGPSSLSSEEVSELPDEVRSAMARAILGSTVQYDTEIQLDCVECGNPFRFVYDPVHSLLSELRASRLALLKEVHCLAYYYHWSEKEILGLPRSRRREYLTLLDQELTSQGQGVLL